MLSEIDTRSLGLQTSRRNYTSKAALKLHEISLRKGESNWWSRGKTTISLSNSSLGTNMKDTIDSIKEHKDVNYLEISQSSLIPFNTGQFTGLLSNTLLAIISWFAMLFCQFS